MNKFLELAERCENAGVADREIDESIFVALYGPDKGALSRIRRGRSMFNYTSSLDAAMTLMPYGWDWAAGIDTLEGFPAAYASASPTEQPFLVVKDIFAEAATHALALCAAALRARHAAISG